MNRFTCYFIYQLFPHPLFSKSSLTPLFINYSLTPLFSNVSLTPLLSNVSLTPLIINSSFTPLFINYSLAHHYYLYMRDTTSTLSLLCLITKHIK